MTDIPNKRSIDEEPKTGSKHGRVLGIILIVLIVAFALLFLYLGFIIKSSADFCQTTENPDCYMLTCPASSPSARVCTDNNGDGYAYRCVGDGLIQCSSHPGFTINLQNTGNSQTDADGKQDYADGICNGTPAPATTADALITQ